MDKCQNLEGMIQTSGHFRMKVIGEGFVYFRVTDMSIECVELHVGFQRRSIVVLGVCQHCRYYGCVDVLMTVLRCDEAIDCVLLVLEYGYVGIIVSMSLYFKLMQLCLAIRCYVFP